ncbi:MAG TPA: ABC transporter permease [Candidatus Wallbacteria bacterium]|nr:MAG: Sulfate transport system permease protein CysW [bacterium ADurb.Bin243]HOD39418.1 ABC transporter permease [Candidatus Wallbacteria bacterium]HPG57083.1 ABC transporter permease [Candidatus Wallbacteria bacterium]
MRFKKIAVLAAFSLFIFYFILLASLFTIVEPAKLSAILKSERFYYSIKISFITAFVTTALSVAIAVPAAYALSRSDFRFKPAVDLFLELPLIISPIALGALLLLFFNTGAGLFIQNNLCGFVYEIPGIIIAQFVTSAGVATRLIKAAIDEIPPRYEFVARTLGAGEFKSFYTITLPLAKNSIIAAAVLTFAKCVGEFGATVTLAGAMPMKTETLPIAIYLRLSNADIEGAAVFILTLLALGFTVTLITRMFLKVRHG